jgi:hypothetical protein
MEGVFKGVKWRSLVSDQECIANYLKGKEPDLKKRSRKQMYLNKSKYLNHKSV